MSDWLEQQLDEDVERVQERIATLDDEITGAAAMALNGSRRADLRRTAHTQLGGLLIERLALQAMVEARDAALEAKREGLRLEREYREKVIKPIADAEADRRRREAEDEAKDSIVRAALDRVKACRPRVAKPDPADIEVLRQNSRYQDRYTGPDYVEQLLWRIDHQPWWPEEPEAA